MPACPHRRPLGRLVVTLMGVLGLGPGPAPLRAAADPPLAAITIVGAPEIVFSRKDRCDDVDVPDAPARAFRDSAGHVAVFAMHYEARALRGAGLDRLTLDCRVALGSAGKADPAAYDDQSWITATWTEDGKRVAALIHHEYRANGHPGRCRSSDYMACWYNTLLAAASTDGGVHFARPEIPAVVAAAPFRQEVGQGRHRGFFNPSNIVADGPHRYFFSNTTGWPGQPGGACLFRTDDPTAGDPRRWRAWDGAGFTIAYHDPYRAKGTPRACRPVAPFPASVGAVVRHRGSKAWLAVFQAAAGGDFPESGFYYTASRDLLAWDTPRLLVKAKTLYDDPCGAGGGLIAYPSLLDRGAKGRNFDDVGDAAELYFTTLKVEGCQITSDRNLVRRAVAIKVWP